MSTNQISIVIRGLIGGPLMAKRINPISSFSICIALVIIAIVLADVGRGQPPSAPADIDSANTKSVEIENPRAVWQEVISAVKAIQNPACGKGSALVTSTGPIGPSENSTVIMDFEFEDNLSRSTRFAIANQGEKGKKEITWSQGTKYSIVYNIEHITLQEKPARQFYRRLGYDFNPETFLRWSDSPISDRLERFLNNRIVVLSVEKDANGILHLIGRYEDPNQRHYRVSNFDPAKGYRPVRFYDSIEFLKDREKDINDTYTIEWTKYGSVWYVKSAKIESVYWAKDINAPARAIMKVIIRDFDPNVSLDSNDFDIEAIGVPKGTTVIDRINNREYKYGSQ